MKIRELKEIIKDLPDDMEVEVYKDKWGFITLWGAEVISDYEGEFLGLS